MPKFDPSFGTLVDVKMSLKVSMLAHEVQANATNFDSAASTILDSVRTVIQASGAFEIARFLFGNSFLNGLPHVALPSLPPNNQITIPDPERFSAAKIIFSRSYDPIPNSLFGPDFVDEFTSSGPDDTSFVLVFRATYSIGRIVDINNESNTNFTGQALGGRTKFTLETVYEFMPANPSLDFEPLFTEGVVQSVFNPDFNGDDYFDLVDGKATVTFGETKILSGNVDPQMANDNIALDSGVLEFIPDGCDDSQSVNIDFAVEPATAKLSEFQNGVEWKSFFTPTVVDDPRVLSCCTDCDADSVKGILRGTIFSEFESNPDNNFLEGPVEFHKVDPLSIAYVPILDCEGGGCYEGANVNDVQNHAAEVDPFLQGILPISDNSLDSLIFLNGFQGDPSQFFPSIALVTDLVGLSKIAKTLQVDKVIGVTAFDDTIGRSGYFDFRGRSGSFGITALGVDDAAIVTDKAPESTPHELGHLFGLDDEYDEDFDYFRNNIFGFFVNNPGIGLIEEIFLFPIANCALERFCGIMGKPENLSKAWISNDNYNQLFEAILDPDIDPELVIISGLIGKDGSTDFFPTLRVDSGIQSPFRAGDGIVRVFDGAGNIVNEIQFPIDFRVRIESDDGPIIEELDFAPFSISVPFAENAERIEIAQNDEILLEINPKSTLLSDVIREIPLEAFRGRSLLFKELRQKILSILTERVEKALNSNHEIVRTRVAKRLLTSLRRVASRIIRDDFEKANPLASDKADVLGAIDSLINKL